MTPRHAPPAARNAQEVNGTADKVRTALPTQKARCVNTGPTLQVSQPHPSRQAKRKGVTAVPSVGTESPVRPTATPRVVAGVA